MPDNNRRAEAFLHASWVARDLLVGESDLDLVFSMINADGGPEPCTPDDVGKVERIAARAGWLLSEGLTGSTRLELSTIGGGISIPTVIGAVGWPPTLEPMAHVAAPVFCAVAAATPIEGATIWSVWHRGEWRLVGTRPTWAMIAAGRPVVPV